MKSRKAARDNERPEETGTIRGSLTPSEVVYEPTDLDLSFQQAVARTRLALRELETLRQAARDAVSEGARVDLTARTAAAVRHLMLAAESTLKAPALAAARPRDAETGRS
ncbi:MAG TPA: hypothetical protein VGS00_04475 [Thermoanaerobaculia bacterium]|nr:hypothetical protein [Thermoanaerobaculia bacterium]